MNAEVTPPSLPKKRRWTVEQLERKQLHDVWRKMKDRCCEPSDPAYPWYGGRGILVCERWMNSFDFPRGTATKVQTMTQQPERDALEAAARAIHDRYEAMTHWVKTLKNEPRQFEESSIRDVHRQDAQVAINAYLAALSAQGMRVIQESELKNAEGALFNAEQHFKMFADEITGDYPARAADDASRPHRLGLCAKLAGEAWRDLYALIYGEQYQEPVYCGPDSAENTDQVRIGKNDPSTESDRAEPSNPSNLAAGGEP